MKLSVSASDKRFPVSAFAWRDSSGNPMITVLCKVTYDLVPGVSVVSPHQLPLSRDEQHWGGDPARSLYMHDDFVPKKRSPEVLLVGTAYAPPGTRVTSLDVKLGVGPWSKSLRVGPDRTWPPSGEDRPFTSMPLVYERAPGGPATDNPVGVAPHSGGPAVLPNLEALAKGHAPGFGPLASSWPRRRQLLGNGAERGPTLEELEQSGLPQGFPDAFFQAAPAEQRLTTLRGALELELVHLHPEIATLKTRLPAFLIQASEVQNRTSAILKLYPDTLWIYTDRGVATVTYRSSLVATSDDVTLALSITPDDRGLPFEGGPNEAARPRAPEASVPAPPAPVPPVLSSPRARPFQTITQSVSLPPVTDMPTPLITASPKEIPLVDEPLAPAPVPPIASSGAQVPSPAPSTLPALSREPTPKPVAHPPPMVPALVSALDASHEEALSLLWFEPGSAASLHRIEAWRKLLKTAEERTDTASDTSDTVAGIEDRRDYLVVLRAAKTQSVATIDSELRTWIGGSGGTKAPPMLIARGFASPSFDETKLLRALVSAARPFGKTDEAFQTKIDEAVAFLDDVDDLTPASDILAAAALLREAFAGSDRRVAPTHLDDLARRTLAEKRAYKEVTLWGGSFVPISIADSDDDSTARSGYLPKDAAMRLPLVPRVEVRAAIDVVPAEEAGDRAASFRVRAIARQLSVR